MTDKPIMPKGRLVFPDFPAGDEIDLRRHRQPTFDPPEFVVSNDDPRASRMHRPAGTVTGRFSGGQVPRFVMQMSVDNRATPEFLRIQRTLKIYRDTAYYGKRIATLLHSTDPRQRKRGRRLRDQRFSFGLNFRGVEERMLAHYRAMHPGIADFWKTNLGEPWDPTRYRKD